MAYFKTAHIDGDDCEYQDATIEICEQTGNLVVRQGDDIIYLPAEELASAIALLQGEQMLGAIR